MFTESENLGRELKLKYFRGKKTSGKQFILVLGGVIRLLKAKIEHI